MDSSRFNYVGSIRQVPRFDVICGSAYAQALLQM